MNDRGKQLCEALGTALATDENLFYLFFFLKHDGFTFYEEDKSNEDAYIQLLGTPIKDENDNVVGKITCLNIDNDIFYATLNRDVKGITYER